MAGRGRREMCTEFWWGNLSVRPRRRWKADIKIYAEVKRLENVDWIDLAQDKGEWRAVLNYIVTT